MAPLDPSSAPNRFAVQLDAAWRQGLVCLAFWLALWTAAALFACVLIAPKLMTLQKLQGVYRSQHRQLSSLERQVGQLERVIVALRTDASFRAEIARLELDAREKDEELVPVDRTLMLRPASQSSPVLPADPVEATWLSPLANDRVLRRNLLIAAVLLIVGGFTFLPPAAGSVPPADRSSATDSPPKASWLARRYHSAR